MTKNVWAYMTRATLALVLTVAWCVGFAVAGDYENTVSGWTDHKDVAAWLENNFVFDKKRQGIIQKRLKSQGPSGLLIRDPETLFNDSKGYCGDSANFALDALSRVDPEYNPRWIFIENSKPGANHWVTGYTVEGKLYVMDFGTGKKWQAIQGVHGPYGSLDEYVAYLKSVNMKGFGVADVRWRDMPGTVD
ncbi:transglutaminase-like domain-containing protein [Magnetovibrio sp.]|uniref:transglutaminase-like domain-containing protein n=1 Tax=Magnetovibrio sp. TaxID=2024836 RepID=UPI002F9285B8